MKKLMIVVSAFYLVACSSPSSYVEADSSRDFGYTESRLTDNRYRVSYKGNANTTSDEVKDMALLRAAEVTLLNNYDWFRVVTQESTESTTSTPATVSGSNARQVVRDCGPLGCTTTITPAYTGTEIVTVRELDHYATSIEIVMGDGELADPTAAYDASELRNTLARRY